MLVHKNIKSRLRAAEVQICEKSEAMEELWKLKGSFEDYIESVIQQRIAV